MVGASPAGLPVRMIVAGTGMRGSGYPNAANTVRILRDLGGWQIDDRARWLPEGSALWKSVNGSRAAFLRRMLGLVLGNLAAAVRLLAVERAGRDLVYAPYPAVFLLWWLSWVPRGLRPRVVADTYISLWDSAFRDRAMGARDGWPSRLAKWFEGRALRAASMVLVDTIANRDWMTREFRILAAKIHAIPLAIDDRALVGSSAARDRGQAGTLRVVYLGTLVPLHGVGVVVDAVAQLAMSPDFEFHFVGDGQQSAMLERLLDPPNQRIAWRRQWLLEPGVADLLGQADVSLGVFGGSGKASRVLPFKVYLSLAAGTPVLTQREFSLPEGVPPPPVYTVDPDAGQIAGMLGEIAANRRQLAATARASRDYYLAFLGPEAVLSAWKRLMGPPQVDEPG